MITRNTPRDDIMEDLLRIFTVITDSMHWAGYLFKIQEQRLVRVSRAFMEMTGIAQEDIDNSRVTNFASHVHSDDLDLLIAAGIKSEELLMNCKQKGEDPGKFIFKTNFRLKVSGVGYRYVDHQSYPLYLYNNTFPEMSVNILEPSRKRGIDRLTVCFADSDVRLLYSRKQNKFVPEYKMQLKDIELEILRLTSEGRNEKQICKKLGAKPSLVNYYKREIFNKLNVNTMREAVYISLLSDLISANRDD